MEINSINGVQIKRNKKFLTPEARCAHVREYQASGKSMIVYCEKHQIVLSTFKNWVRKYGLKKASGQFVPLMISPKNTNTEIHKSKSSFCCEIHMGNIKIIFPEISDNKTFIQFIQGLSYANSIKSTDNIIF